MAKISLPYNIVNGDAVDAGPVESNYQTIETYTNQELIERGGTVAMTAQLKLVGNPVAALDAAPKQYVDQVVPIGGILLFAGSTAPAGGTWLLCDGTEYQAATYPELAAVIGASAGRFNVPALVNRFPVGGGGAYAHKTTGGNTDATGLPAHSHDTTHTHDSATTSTFDHNHVHDVGGSTGAADRPLGTSNDGGHTHSPGAPGLNFIGNGGAGEAAVRADSDGYTFFHDTTNNGAHTHTVTDHNHGFSATTAGIKAGWATAHSHTFQPPTFNGASGSTGVNTINANLPPYFAIAFIIRAK